MDLTVLDKTVDFADLFRNFVLISSEKYEQVQSANPCVSFPYRVPKWETRSQEGWEVLRYLGYLLRCRSRKGMSVDLVCYVVWKNRP